MCFTVSGYSQAIQALRYDDDFSYLKDDSLRKHQLHLKYMKLANGTYLSIGGELRQQVMHYQNISFGEIPSSFTTPSTWQTLHRTMLHMNFEAGKHVRVFTQLYNSIRFINPNPRSVVDENDLDLLQAFVDIKPLKNITLRFGRQEFLFGKEKFISVREGPNNQQSFDAATFKYNSGKINADMYYARQVIPSKAVFDDRHSDEYITGVYTRFTAIPKWALLEVFFHAFGSDSRTYNFTTGREKRNTVGFRAYSANKKFNYDLESAIQRGTFTNKKINAYFVSYDINYLAGKKWQAGLAGNIVTGDKDPNDNMVNTYNTMFGKPPFGQAAGQGLSNTKNYNPYLRLYLNPDLNILGGVSVLKRESNKDAIYTNGMRATRPAQDKLLEYSSSKIGQIYNVDINIKFNNNLTSVVQYATFIANDFIKQSGKSNEVSFLSMKGAYRF